MFLAEAIERIILCLTMSGQRCDVAKCSPEQLTQVKGGCSRGARFRRDMFIVTAKNTPGFPFTNFAHVSNLETFKTNAGFRNIRRDRIPTII